jgi:hypothetical protein
VVCFTGQSAETINEKLAKNLQTILRLSARAEISEFSPIFKHQPSTISFKYNHEQLSFFTTLFDRSPLPRITRRRA